MGEQGLGPMSYVWLMQEVFWGTREMAILKREGDIGGGHLRVSWGIWISCDKQWRALAVLRNRFAVEKSSTHVHLFGEGCLECLLLPSYPHHALHPSSTRLPSLPSLESWAHASLVWLNMLLLPDVINLPWVQRFIMWRLLWQQHSRNTQKNLNQPCQNKLMPIN